MIRAAGQDSKTHVSIFIIKCRSSLGFVRYWIRNNKDDMMGRRVRWMALQKWVIKLILLLSRDVI